MKTMKILRLVIRYNKRLLDKGTETVEWEPQSSIQVIIGGNGNGKSSLGREISPLPATKGDYEANGYKEVLVDTGSEQYKCISDFGDKHTHKFIRMSDDKNLNEGGTSKVQLKLVKTYLNFTPRKHQLLCGDLKFTQMSANERKAIFTEMCDVNVDYAIELFESLKKQLSVAKGAYTHANRKLVEEQNNQYSDEEIDAIQGRLRKLTEETNKVLTFRDNFVERKDRVELVEKLESAIVHLSEESRKINISHIGYSSLEELQDARREVIHRLDDVSESIESKSNALEKLQSTLDKVSEGSIKKEELVRSIAITKEKLQVLQSKSVSKLSEIYDLTQLGQHSSDTLSAAYDSLHLSLSDIDSCLNRLQELSVHEFTKEKMEDIRVSHKQLVAFINNTSAKISMLEHSLKLIDGHDPSKCPKCKHEWIEGVTKEELEEKRERLKKFNALAEKADERLKVRDEELANVDEWVIAIQRYQDTIANCHTLVRNVFYNQIDLGDILKSAGSYISLSRDILKELDKYRQIASMKSNLQSSQEQLDYCNNLEKLTQEQNLSTASVDQLNNEIDKLHEKEIELRMEKDKLQRLEMQCQTLIAYMGKMKELESELINVNVELTKERINTLVDNKVMDLESHSSELSKKMAMFNSSNAIIDHLTKTVDDLELDQQLISLAMEELGPEKGLIAESLNSFMGEFIEQMNLVIGSIWTTPLKVMPCSVSKRGLDYMFPVMSYEKERATKDVKLRSEGEMEIIDFVFTLIAASCMSLEGYPLFLDEVGRPFTEKHKVRLYDYIKLLVDSDKVSTIFLVSHFLATVEVLTRADVVNLDPTGLTIKAEHNKDFKINVH